MELRGTGKERIEGWTLCEGSSAYARTTPENCERPAQESIHMLSGSVWEEPNCLNPRIE
jgi:hypothetical protein